MFKFLFQNFTLNTSDEFKPVVRDWKEHNKFIQIGLVTNECEFCFYK